MKKYLALLILPFFVIGCSSMQEIENKTEVGLYGTYKAFLLTMNESVIFIDKNVENQDVREEYFNLFTNIAEKTKKVFDTTYNVIDTISSDEMKDAVEYIKQQISLLDAIKDNLQGGEK